MEKLPARPLLKGLGPVIFYFQSEKQPDEPKVAKRYEHDRAGGGTHKRMIKTGHVILSNIINLKF
ncbi:hypothetical protein QA596_07650 [Balneolales bacterium ANBcel1]|nr:hypothetical protein [Balneolales bacterium ANBcel1]